jgi:hypothetical protein
MDRGEILDTAKALTFGERNTSYEAPLRNHERIGILMGIVLEKYVEDAQPGDPVPPHTAALCMAAMKLARLSAKPDHLDSAIDGAAYFSIAGELATEIPHD